MRNFINIVSGNNRALCETKVVSSATGMFGPFYHGTTKHKMKKIVANGFRVHRGEAQRNGFKGYGSSSLPLQTLGYGVYFTLDRNKAASYSRRNGISANELPTFFLESNRILRVNLADEAALAKWAKMHGFNFEWPAAAKSTTRVPIYADETEGGVPPMFRNGAKIIGYRDGTTILVDHPSVEPERERATEHMTTTLSAMCDAVWLCGQDDSEPFDGEQVCVYNPELIRRLDNLNESVIHVQMRYGKLKVIKNPSKIQLINFIRQLGNGLRGFSDNKQNIYVWDARDATHDDVQDGIGVDYIHSFSCGLNGVTTEHDDVEKISQIPALKRAYGGTVSVIVNPDYQD